MKNANTTTTKCRKGGKTKSPSKLGDSNRAIVPRRQNKLDQSLRALNLTREQLATCQPLESVLKQALGNISQAIEAMRFSDDPVIKKFLLRYDMAPKQQQESLPLEAFALSADVPINALFGATIFAFQSLQSRKSQLSTLSRHPKVVEATIDVALTPKGTAEKRMVHEAVGWLPTRQGVSINQVFAGQLPVKQNDRPVPVEVQGEEAEFDELFEPITTNLEGWQHNKQKLLRGE